LIIDKTLVKKIAALANLEFSEQEIEDFTRQFSQIVEFVRQLSEVGTSGVDVDDIHGRQDSALFDDRAQHWLGPDQALANAPERDGEFFLVPKVIADE
jgi:aspartyl-tRNA(Asn)/glutamyl-tRNA(Gln) amidotransferase subunit C